MNNGRRAKSSISSVGTTTSQEAQVAPAFLAALTRRLVKSYQTIFGVQLPVAMALLLVLALTCEAVVAPLASAGTRRARPRRAAHGAQSPNTLTIYGPRRFDRTAGAPVSVVESFSLPADAVPAFTLFVENGAADGAGRVSSATIKLNGAEVFTPHEFSQNVATLTKPVSLTATNQLDVRLTSAVGSFLTITVITSRASLQTVDPVRAVQGQTLTVTLRGRNTRWAAEQTRLSLGAEVSVGGAAAGEYGPVTVVDAVTATAQVVVSPTASLAPRAVLMTTTIPGENRNEIEILADAFKVGAFTPPASSSSTVSTLAGLGGGGFADGPAAQARFNSPAGIAIGADDSIYVADAGNNRIRVIGNQPDGAGNPVLSVATLAGDGTAGFADGTGAQARFNNPQGVAVDLNGIVYVADTENHRIRRIAADGTVTTWAGDGIAGFANGVGAQARFNAPRGLAADSVGNLYVADTGNAAVRSISAAGNVATVAGDGTIGANDSPSARFDGLTGIATDGATLYAYITDTGNHRIRRLAPGGSVITLAGGDRGFADGSAAQARFADPAGIAVDGAGKIIVADATNSLVRYVDPTPALGGSPQAVTTLAGTGERGLTDGAGNTARFAAPRGVAVSLSSAILVADTGSHVLRRVTLPPLITSVTPLRARPGDTLSMVGERFDGRSPANNTVRFNKQGGGQITAQVTAATRTQIAVVVPADAASGPITVETAGGTATSPTSLDILFAPVITDFSPHSGTVGSVVTLNGTALKAPAGPTQVTFTGSRGARLEALATSVSATLVQVLVPNAAVTGTIELSNAGGRAVSPTVFTLDPGENDYQITVAPSATTAVQGSSGTFVIFATSPVETFSQLISLSATGLPAGAVATFAPEQITAGAQSVLSVSLAGSLAPGSYPFTIRAFGLVNGSELTRSASAMLNVIAAGQTTLSGRVLSVENEPILGATVSLDGKTAMTDAAGAFLLSGITAGAARPLMVDGRTASAPNRTYPVIIEPAAVAAAQANVVPYPFYLPPIDTPCEVEVVPGQNTLATNPRVPDLQMTIPPGANLRNRDGSPVARASITPLAIDRTPAPLPANVGTPLVFTSQPGGAVADLPMPVVYPNLAGADPGTRIELYAFNHDTVQWYVYGYGRVSPDGRTIVPETDPATGRPYGLRDFSWHFANAAPEGNPSEMDCGNQTENTVDLSSGVKIERTTDISFGGARGGLTLTRIYTRDLASSCSSCPFGPGTTHNYYIRLVGSFQAGGAGRVVFPEQVTGRLFSYLRTDADGALVFSTTATRSQLGHELRHLTNGTFEYRGADDGLMRFDSAGKLTALVDRNGNTTTLSYSGSNLMQVTDPVGRSLTFQYDSANRIIQVTDPLSRVWRYTYEGTPGPLGGPGLTTVTDPLDQVVRYEYTNLSRLVKVIDRRGNVKKEITYDGGGRVIRETLAGGGFETYDYTLSGNIVTAVKVTDSLGRRYTKRFNASGYVLGMTDALGQTARIDRDLTTNLPTLTTGPCGCTESVRQFDSRGNPIATTDRLGQTTRFEYDPASNNVTKITDKLGRALRFDYDSRGNLTSITDALNQTTTLAYDSFGELLSSKDALGHTTRIEYDAYGNISAVTDALGNRGTFEPDVVGRVTAVVDPLGRRVSQAFDARDQVILATDAVGTSSAFTYDENGNRLTATDALQRQTRMAYDTKNRLVAVTDALGGVSRVEYDTEDQVSALISASGRMVRYGYDPRGLLTTVTDALNNVARMSYDNRGNPVAVIDQRGATTTYGYDGLYRLVTRRDPLGRSDHMSYDAVGNLIERVDRLGRQTTMTYDALDRLTRAVYADAEVTYTYDAASRLRRVDDTQAGSIEWTYDDADRLLTETTAAGVVSYGYNSVGEVTSMTAADRPVIYVYDAAGRLQSLTQAGESFTYGYDLLSRLISLQRPNGVSTSYSYDALDRLARMTHARATAPAVEDYQYTYNADDKIETITTLASVPLTPVAKASGTPDAMNRISQFGNTSYAFDSEGQTTGKTDAAGTTTYEWDARGRLKRAGLPTGQSVSYAYDAAGRLASRTAAGQTINFLSDGADVVVDRHSDGSRVDYLNGSGMDEKLRQASAAGTHYFLTDHLGSTIALVDQSGAVVERQSYEPFGASGGSSLTRYGYTGRELDSATGLMYYRARWYDPQQGRFLSEDPAGFAGGDLNLYAYVGGDPVSQVDPTGMTMESPLSSPYGSSVVREFGEFMEEMRRDALDWEFGLGDPNELVEVLDPCAAELAADYQMPVMQAGFGGFRVLEQLFGLRRLAKTRKFVRLSQLIKLERGPIIIGEKMERVREYARGNGGKTYKGWMYKYLSENIQLRLNEQWLRKQIRKGREIIDIGPSFERRTHRGISPFYEMERRVIREVGYKSYREVYIWP